MKNRFPREFYIPKGAVKVSDKASSAVAYVYEGKNGPAAVAFQRKADKPSFHYRYRDAGRRAKAVQDFFASIQKWEQTRRDRAAARKAEANPYKVGDVLH